MFSTPAHKHHPVLTAQTVEIAIQREDDRLSNIRATVRPLDREGQRNLSDIHWLYLNTVRKSLLLAVA